MLDRVAATIARYGMFRPSQKVGVAVSGGADSVCLLHVLLELASGLDLRLSVLHLNHKLRGEESRADADFVAEMAARHGLPFHLREQDVAAVADDNLEQAARNARRAFFRDMIAAGDADRVALGHTRSDQAETVLFRILRGAGTAGLAGIRPVTAEGLVRPLIGISREEARQFLRERGIAWREDSSNADLRFDRNRIRSVLLPELEREWNPAVEDALANMADQALEEERYWDAEVSRVSSGHFVMKPPALLCRADWLAGLPAAAARRVVRRAIESVKGDLRGIEFRHIRAILYLAESTEGSGRMQTPGLDVFRSFDWLRIAPPSGDNLRDRNYRMALAVPGRAELPEGSALQTEIVENPGAKALFDSVYNGGVCFLDRDRVSGALEVRNWRPGDQYQPSGHTEQTKIKLLFQTGRIPLWERRHWPVVTSGEAIVWARRFGPAAGLAATAESRRVLRIEETAD